MAIYGQGTYIIKFLLVRSSYRSRQSLKPSSSFIQVLINRAKIVELEDSAADTLRAKVVELDHTATSLAIAQNVGMIQNLALICHNCDIVLSYRSFLETNAGEDNVISLGSWLNEHSCITSHVDGSKRVLVQRT